MSEWAGMPSEWRFVVHSLIIETFWLRSVCIPNIQAHSCNLQDCFAHVQNFRVHSKWRNIERHFTGKNVWLRVQTWLTSNLRQTTWECVYFVRRSHIRSRDKDGSHTIRSAMTENPILHANFTALFSVEPRVIADRSFTLPEWRISRFFAAVTQWTFIYTNLTRNPWGCERRPKINFIGRGFQKL